METPFHGRLPQVSRGAKWRVSSKAVPDRLEDRIGEDHLVRAVDLFVDNMDLSGPDFVRLATARIAQAVDQRQSSLNASDNIRRAL